MEIGINRVTTTSTGLRRECVWQKPSTFGKSLLFSTRVEKEPESRRQSMFQNKWYANGKCSVKCWNMAPQPLNLWIWVSLLFADAASCFQKRITFIFDWYNSPSQRTKSNQKTVTLKKSIWCVLYGWLWCIFGSFSALPFRICLLEVENSCSLNCSSDSFLSTKLKTYQFIGGGASKIKLSPW